MPHKCTECERIYADGDDAIMNGCATCSHNQFQFVPIDRFRELRSKGHLHEEDGKVFFDPPEETPESTTESESTEEDSEIIEAESNQKYSEDELDQYVYGGVVDNQDKIDERKQNINEIKEELDSQFQSIKIVGRGEYELNLKQIYETDEQIIQIKEDGTYIIDLPEAHNETEGFGESNKKEGEDEDDDEGGLMQKLFS